MANNPPTINISKYKGSGNVQVFPLLPTQLLGDQDGSDVGTGGPALPALESPPVGSFVNNRNIEFLDDRFCAQGGGGATTSGIYKRSQGGAGQWGRIGVDRSLVAGAMSGLHVLHPNGVPTMAAFAHVAGNTLYIRSTSDGATVTDVSGPGGGFNPVNAGQSLVFRESLVWAHGYVGGAVQAQITQYDFALSTLTHYNVTSIFHLNQAACNIVLHVHDNVLFALAGDTTSAGAFRLAKLQAGAFQTVWTATNQWISANGVANATGHSAMFTDETTGDLILILSGDSSGGGGDGARAYKIMNATGSPVAVEITTQVLGPVYGADKYLNAGGAENEDRRWSVLVDTDSDPLNPRTFLWTWVAGGGTECWEWQSTSDGGTTWNELQGVAGLSGISDDFVLPYNPLGGGQRSPRIAAVEIGDAANPVEEVVGGTKIFFRGRGSASAGTATFYGTDTEGTPSTVVPITAGSLVVEGTDLLTGLEAYYKFDGNGNDSAAANDLTANGSASFAGAAKFGSNSGEFPGTTSDYMTAPDNAGLDLGGATSAWALSCWVNADAVASTMTFVNKTNGTTTGYHFWSAADGTIYFNIDYGTGFLASAAGALSSGAGWQHLVVTSDGATARLYVDGAEVDSTASSTWTSDPTPLYLGRLASFTLYPFDGQMDDVGFWSRGLTSGEVQRLYNAGTGRTIDDQAPPTTPSISGNTIINLTPDYGAMLYSVVLDTGAPGVNVGEGEVGLLIATLI